MRLFLLWLLAACGPDVSVSKVAVDADGDGYDSEVDCDDARNDVNPTADEVCDGRDNDCDGVVDEAPTDAATFYADTDADGFGDPDAPLVACERPDGATDAAGDCDDGDATVFPGAEERCNERDDDCDTLVDDDDPDVTGRSTWYRDADGDGWGDAASDACAAPAGFVALAGDCDDADARRNPGVREVCDPADLDEDCSGAADDADAGTDPSTFTTFARDADSDGYGDPTSTITVCDAPAGYIADATDCDDADPAVHPGASEACNGVDDDCDTLVDDADPDVVGGATWHADADADAWGDPTATTVACVVPPGFVVDATDCDDGRSDVSPAGIEVCGDAVDQDCDGADEACVVGGDYTEGDAFARIHATTADLGLADALDAVGDVDGDGHDDVVLLARWASDTAAYQGVAYVFSGPLSGDYAVDAADATLWGEDENDILDFTTNAGDLDGDGVDDLVVGGQGADPDGLLNEGGIYVLNGPVSGTSNVSAADGVIAGGAAGRLMRVAHGLGDINGDGNDDLAVSTWGHGISTSDYATVFYGPITGRRTLTSANLTVRGASSDDGMGELDGGEDVDGDGVSDFVFGTPYNDAAASGAGAMYVVFGPLISGTVSSLYDVRYTGDALNEWFGLSVQMIPDLDGDGYAEVLGTSYYESFAALVYGGALPASGTIASRYDALFVGAATAFSDHNQTPRGAGDLDGDGDEELIVSDTLQTLTGADRGVAAVFDAPLGTFSFADADLRYTGDTDGDALGRGRAAGDMSGDGLPDLMVSVAGDDAGERDAGAVWLFSPR